MKSAIVVPCLKAQSVRKLLEKEGLWDKTRKLQKQDCDKVVIPVNTDNVSVISHHLPDDLILNIQVIQTNLPCSKSQLIVPPAEWLLQSVKQLLEQHDTSESSLQRLLAEVPNRWEKHGDLVLLPANAFLSQEWKALGKGLWEAVAKCLVVQRVARQSVVSADGFRRPQVTLLLGDSGVVQHVDNDIIYEYDITRCMFSSGNVTEKLRLAHFSCKGETVVDMYAGIGYFTLPYLVHARASYVIACEWNPDAVSALKQNLELNHVRQRCSIIQGDNRQLKLKGVADRVNLGLIPSSEDSWPVACRLLKDTGGFLHIHGNVNTHTASCEKLMGSDSASSGIIQDSFGIVKTWNSESQCSEAEDETNRVKQPEIDPEKHASETQSDEPSHDLDGNENVSDVFVQTVAQNDPRNMSVMLGSNSSNCGVSVQKTFSVSEQSAQIEHMRTDHKTQDNQTAKQPESTYTLGHRSQILSKTGASGTSSTSSKSVAWSKWGKTVCASIKTLLEEEHGGYWQVNVTHIEPIKSYAPYVHHVVLDIYCTPADSANDC